ncbi:MAG: tRNA (N(6)-L-threonylcarbamoyladenosine(37)-C(2))-methylthiotransferase MtaB [Firmicutes bacterium]|nr:tRNA (N(6)-L-threonylcarbamoyladenosine(37)-C(2))-methylthiotransferase MtaB [Bacillota bacterium]
MKAVVYTLGCKVNQYESFSIINDLKKSGYEVSSKLEPADLYIVNTCSVTAEAERQSRQILSKIEKLNRFARIIICGCASQNFAEQFKNKNLNITVLGTFGKGGLVKNLESLKFAEPTDIYEDNLFTGTVKTRAFIKVQDGCDNYCSYCIVPYVRGRSRSRKIESIVYEIESLKDVKEIVLTGINLSDYGKNIDLKLTDLINALNNIDKRLRLGSLEVNIIDDSFLTALQNNKNFCPHFHLSLQSGSDKVLADMNRKYTAYDFLGAAKKIREYFKAASVTTDVIVGYPTESEDDFLQTYEFCRDAEIFNMHIFPYSTRKGTKASGLKPLEKAVVKARVQKLSELNKELNKSFITKNANSKISVLIEEFKGGYYIGHSENYIKCYFKSANLNEIKTLEKSAPFKDGLIEL